MILYNIPMYWRIFRHDEEEGKTYLSILEGIVDSWRTSVLLTGSEPCKGEAEGPPGFLLRCVSMHKPQKAMAACVEDP